MVSKFILALLPLLLQTVVGSDFGLAGSLFQLSGGATVNNAKLRWAVVNDATQYVISRSINGAASTQIATVAGDQYDDYDLLVGTTYDYQITAQNGNSAIGQSETFSVSPFAPTGTYSTFENLGGSSLGIKSNLESNGVYYQYNYESYSNGSMQALVQQTSSDGYNFSGDTVVLNGETVCASVGYSCMLQAINYQLNPTTGDIVMWAHLENTENYDLGQVAVAHCTPGQAFTFDGTYQPLGHDSRDLTLFADGDNAYVISATDTNTNMNIYALTSNWTAVASLADEVYINDYREAPTMIESDGYYYLYTSRAAGWYPSQPEYIVASSITGPWSDPVVVGNTATYCSQSGYNVQLTNGQYAMISSVWAAQWSPSDGNDRSLFLPIAVSSDGGYSSYTYYQSVQYSDAVTTANQAMYGVQSGKILSNYQPSSSNAGTTNIAYANDGTQDNPNNTWVPNTLPFYYTIDLGSEYTISQVDLTTNMVQGSETYYQFSITGSTDNTTFTTLANQMSNTQVGFVPSFPNATTPYRYIQLNVQNIINTHNGNSATWAAGFVEVTVYGN